MGTLPMQAPELAVEEMERCVKELGFPGIQIGSHINMWDLNDPELFPIYTVSIVAFTRPVQSHTASGGGGPRRKHSSRERGQATIGQ